MKKLEMFMNPAGKSPYREWFIRLDEKSQARVTFSLDIMCAGAGKKNIRSLRDGIFELKVNFGPGYSVYFGQIGNVIILLLLGGDKSTQFRDILKAKEYWGSHVSKRRI